MRKSSNNSILRRLREKGILPPIEGEIEAKAKAIVERSRLENTIPLAERILEDFYQISPSRLKWLELPPTYSRTNIGGSTEYSAIAGIPRSFCLKVTRNQSGQYVDNHFVSLHYLESDGRSFRVGSQIVGMWLKCHFSYDRPLVANFANTTLRQYIENHK